LIGVDESGRTPELATNDDPPFAFWRVETPGRELWRSPLRVTGDEQPQFFHEVARLADKHG
jgi:hypothetical protein